MAHKTDTETTDVGAAILVAAESCFEQFGITKTTMADVARAANMSRATVYRYFSDRESLIVASIVRRARMNMEPWRVRIRNHPTFGERIVEGLCANIRRGLRDPMIHLLVSPAEATLATTLLATSGRAVQLTRELWEPILLEARESGELRADVDLDLLYEWLSEIEMNYISALGASAGSLDRLRAKLYAFVVPSLLARP
ncbi:helix-turn-helix domain-containing protein [Rhodococcus aetherivorans]|uniref:TetR/AcrR family transcriptional regulator n=1 Tax=Rhodococcus TaxID=1827 RepID=UPI000622C677|nr:MULTISPECIES: TetR/AcrR family transcriptional regulator [Rhodococcus]AKE88761.1 TetR family transcriptional regulator [Rhodococcus aetherivorans]MBC2591579.1 TetR/AcrR family transcriptional regulator [Rhodococcus aetherivorans]PND51355.1 TetR/AcrR family transcriptional regulator [Rhodococcus sp. ENV425]WKW99804.1 helix-turn-helix domain-containing protein [Rhodococcus aetherivorans]